MLQTTEEAGIFVILLTIMATYENGDVLDLFKKHMARGRKSNREERDKTSDNGPMYPTGRRTTDTADVEPVMRRPQAGFWGVAGACTFNPYFGADTTQTRSEPKHFKI